MLALCYCSRFPFSFVPYFWVLKGKVSSGRGESIPALPKMFLPCAVKVKVLACKGDFPPPKNVPLCSESESTCLQGRVVVATGRWQCQCLPQLYGTVVYGACPPLLLGTNSPYNRSSPGLHAGFFAFALNYLSFRVKLRFEGKPVSL